MIARIRPWRSAAFYCVFIVAAGGHPARAEAEEKTASSLGRRIDDFSLRDFRGKTHRLADYHSAKVVVVAFLGTECPLVKLYAPRLAELHKRFRDRDVVFLGVNANVHDSVTEINHFARRHRLEFPILKDVGNVVADRFAAQRTPEVYALDADRKIRYAGRIDDQYGIGYARPKVGAAYLADAIDQLLAGKKVERPAVKSVGCHIGRVRRADPSSKVTYSNRIAHILQRRCVECHREGEIAPFALTRYDEVAGWAEMIDEVVRERRMPPWHADPKHGKFANDARLPDDEKQAIHQWVKAGAPEGDRSQLPPPRKFSVGWRIGKPDMVINVTDKPVDVQATGEVKYQYFEVDPGFKEDKWIRAAEVTPGNRAVVHHILVFVRKPGSRSIVGGRTVRSDWLAGMAPGSPPMDLPESMAKFVPAGAKLVFQVHYTPNGSPQKDQSKLGLIFADPKKVKKEVGIWRAANVQFQIPANSRHTVTASHRFKHDTLLLSMFPHMHLRGKSFRYEAIYPDGRRETLLDVPQYDFNWQLSYMLAEPKLLPAGTKMHCTAVFDNTDDNLANPAPNKSVRWGDQTWEEMMIGYFAMMRADQDLTKQGAQTRTEQFQEHVKEHGPPKLDETTRALATAALADKRSLARLAAALRKVAPQLDRVDWTTIDDGKLHIRRVAQQGEAGRVAADAGLKIDAKGLALAEYARGSEPVAHGRLGERKEIDLKFLSRMFTSSLHVPRKIGGAPGTINFYSREADAFPPAAVELLRDAASRMSTAKQ